MYKAVLFDLFGTLIAPPSMEVYRQMVRDIADSFGVTFDELYEPWMSINDGRLDGSFGSSEGDILAAAELVNVEVSEKQMTEVMNLRRSITRDFLQPKQGVIEMLDELAEMDIAIGLVTDCVFDVPAVWADTEFFTYFSATHFSCVTNIRKPDARTYQAVLDLLEVDASSALFVGDGGSDELNGAVRAGMDAVQIDDLGATSGEMLRVGVTDWDGSVITSMSAVSDFVRSNDNGS